MMTIRHAKTFALTLLLCSTAPLNLMSRPMPIPVSDSEVSADRLPDTKLRLGKVTLTRDVVYSMVPGYRPMLLDLYRPDGQGPHPLVIFIHGGSWTTGSKRATANFSDFPGLLAALAGRGFTVASVDYRLGSEAKYPAALQDIKAAIRFLRANAGKYGIDRRRVAVWGASAGAHLAAMAALTGDDPALEPTVRNNPEQSDCVQALVGWYGPYNMPVMFRYAMANAPAPGTPMTPEAAAESIGPLNFFGCTMEGCGPGVLEKASPVNHIDRNDPPALLIHGTADTKVPPEQSVELDNGLKAAGVKSDLLLINNVGHSWTGENQPATAAASRKAVAATFDWLEKKLKRGG
ncbi:MAG: alpha/beta hydrolase, partial [Chlorobiaceae bacterium]|nr:alpha/beta hydrolase [Chlorobiaceae bacterium]